MKEVPDGTVKRLSLYCRYLKNIKEQNIKVITSSWLAEKMYVQPAQVRKDLSYIGQFGARGIGYNVEELILSLEKILGLNKKWPVALVGAGNLGRALFAYPGFKKQGFEFAAIFDVANSKIGKRWGDLKISSSRNLSRVIKQKGIKIAVIAVPAQNAQQVANQLIKAGVKAILNFAPYKLGAPQDVKSRNVDMATELESLSYFLCSRNISKKKNL